MSQAEDSSPVDVEFDASLPGLWASLVAQLTKNPPAMQKTWVRSLGWKILWRREPLPTPVFLPGEFHGQKNLAGSSTWGCEESDMTEHLSPSSGLHAARLCLSPHPSTEILSLYPSIWVHASVLITEP